MTGSIRIALAADHAGFALKQTLLRAMSDLAGELTVEVTDEGPATAESVDYPDFAARVARGVSEGRYDRGVLVCGSGQGMAMTANRFSGVRAAVCFHGVAARLAREHNDANVLCLGARLLGEELAKEITRQFLAAQFESGRHVRRVSKIETAAKDAASPGSSAASDA